jgi:drug/metabolite transporter (DMT)-like permease
MVVAAYRLGLSVIILAPGYLCLKRPLTGRLSPNVYPWVVLAGLFLGAHFIAWIEAVQRVPVAVAVTISSTHPIFVGTLSHLLMKEKPGCGLVIGILMALVGVSAMAWSDRCMAEGEWKGYGLALSASLLFSGYVIVGRGIRKTVDLMSYVLPTYGTAAVFLLGLVWLTGLTLLGYDPQTYGMFFLLALVPTAIGHSTLNWALRYVPATLVAISVLGEPVGATLLAALLFHELPDALKVLGGLIILIGIYVAARDTLIQ